MGKQKSNVPFEGRVGGMVYYTTKKGEARVRTAAGPSKSKIQNDPKFVNVRANNGEFGRASSAGRFLREAFRKSFRSAEIGTTHWRLSKKLLELIKADPIHGWGERRLLQPQLAGLAGFEWNEDFPVGAGLAPIVTRTDLDITVAIPTGCKLLRSGGQLTLIVVSFHDTGFDDVIAKDSQVVGSYEGATLSCPIPADGLWVAGLGLSGVEVSGVVVV